MQAVNSVGLWRAMTATGWCRRGVSSNSRIVRSQVLRKMRKGLERLPNEGKDPAESFGGGWRLASGVILERYPVIIPEQHPFEQEYLKGRFVAQQRDSRPLPMEAFLSERDIIAGRKEANFKDPLAEQYEPGPRRTKADEQDDRHSLKRALDERLYFIIKSSPDSDNFRFPQILADDDDTPLWSFATKAFKAVTKIEGRPLVHFVSPRPACHLEHVYPLGYQKKHDVYGVKIFFYRAVLLSEDGGHNIDLDMSGVVRNCADYQWARHCELEKSVGSEYFKWIEPALIGVGPSNDFQV